MSPGSLQYVYRWRIGQWSSLAPCVEHNSPPFDADGLCWVFKLFKGRVRNPKDLALYLSVHESSADRLLQQKKKVDVSFTLENLRTRGLNYNKYPTPITVWVDSNYSTWGDDRFISLQDMESFIDNDMTCLVVRFHVRETVHEGPPLPALPSSAIAVYVPDKIAAPFNQLLKSARFSDIQFELRDSSSLLLSPGPHKANTGQQVLKQGLLSPRASGDYTVKAEDALRITYSIDQVISNGQPSPPRSQLDDSRYGRSICITPMPGNATPKALPYSQHRRLGDPPPEVDMPAGPRYHAHKAILMSISPVFEAMFSNGMRETYEKVVEVWDVTPRAFERMLEYAYTRICDLDPRGPQPADVTPDEVVETLLCADQFEVTDLRDICWRNLMSRVAIDTVWDIWSIATDLEAHDQQRTCKTFCCRNFTQLCHAPSIMWAPAHLLREVLISDTLNVQSEELLFETVIRWANFREEDTASSSDSSPPQSRRSSSVLSAGKHVARSGRVSDEAVLKCYRSPSNLSLLPRSPFSNYHQRIASPRRKPALTREAYTSGSDPTGAASPGGVLVKSTANSPLIQNSTSNSPRPSIASTAKLQLIEYSENPPSSSSRGCLGSLFERKEFLATLLPCIRFPMMDKNFLLKVVERNTELMAMPAMKDLLIEAYRYHAFNPPQSMQKERAPSRRSSECYAKKESLPPTTVQAKIILPLNATDELTLSRSQRRKRVLQPKLAIQNIDFS